MLKEIFKSFIKTIGWGITVISISFWGGIALGKLLYKILEKKN